MAPPVWQGPKGFRELLVLKACKEFRGSLGLLGKWAAQDYGVRRVIKESRVLQARMDQRELLEHKEQQGRVLGESLGCKEQPAPADPLVIKARQVHKAVWELLEPKGIRESPEFKDCLVNKAPWVCVE